MSTKPGQPHRRKIEARGVYKVAVDHDASGILDMVSAATFGTARALAVVGKIRKADAIAAAKGCAQTSGKQIERLALLL